MKVDDVQWRVENRRRLGRHVVDRWTHNRETDAESRATLKIAWRQCLMWYFWRLMEMILSFPPDLLASVLRIWNSSDIHAKRKWRRFTATTILLAQLARFADWPARRESLFEAVLGRSRYGTKKNPFRHSGRATLEMCLNCRIFFWTHYPDMEGSQYRLVYSSCC